MNYSIVATLGPASSTEQTWLAMTEAGATAFRLNTSHLSLDELDVWLERLVDFRLKFGMQLPVILDLQGSKWRLGEFLPVELERGKLIRIAPTAKTQIPDTLPVPHEDFFRAVRFSEKEILLNDARVILKVESWDENGVIARVILGGWIEPRKGITLSGGDFRKEGLCEKDHAILQRIPSEGWIHFAISYVSDAREMEVYRSLMGDGRYLIAKLERKSAVEGAKPISQHADALWLCRGDLGAEQGLPAMAELAYRFEMNLGEIKKPVYLAGQVLEHLTDHMTPTRAEVMALYQAIRAGYAGFVLSDETAIGRNPVGACQAAAMFRSSPGARGLHVGKVKSGG
jgi:pyruvate kinase